MSLYTVLWSSTCLAALIVLVRDWPGLASEWREYRRFLWMPWKLALFIPALLFVSFAGHFTNDPTWDVVTGSGMSILTFVTAPWALGVLYQALHGKKPPRYFFIAIVLCLFSASWFYDGYLFLRDGHYTSRWLGNLILSPMTYVFAGLLWNLEVKNRFFCSLSFLRDDWPTPPARLKHQTADTSNLAAGWPCSCNTRSIRALALLSAYYLGSLGSSIFDIFQAPGDDLLEDWSQAFPLVCRRVGHSQSVITVGSFFDQTGIFQLVQSVGQNIR